MAVPSPRSLRSMPLRIRRGKSYFASLKSGNSCFRIVLFLLSVQLFGMFVVTTMSGEYYDTALDNPSDDADKKGQLKELEKGDARQKRVLYNATTDGEDAPALDNYGSRQHFAKRNGYSPSGPYLVVGGSDGSGTRAVVNQLIELGVFFHVEDKKTMDIHGGQMFRKGGWPPLVNLIMNHTHSANYELEDLPLKVQTTAILELKRLKHAIDIQAKSKHGRLSKLQPMPYKDPRKDPQQYATATYIGWKAPVAMVLLPLIQHVFGPTKFLHVVRDGRDVSLSDNQSPVRKFYNTYYGKPPKHPLPDEQNITTYAMQLWNDMNQQVLDYGRTHSDGATLDYLTIRTEDMVHPETKFEALLQLADFVGSQKTVAELCCMSQKELHDMGKSNTPGAADGKRRPRHRPPGPEDFMGMGMTKRDFMEDILHGPGGNRQENNYYQSDYADDGVLDMGEMRFRVHQAREKHQRNINMPRPNKIDRNVLEQKRKEIRERGIREREAAPRPHVLAHGLEAIRRRRKKQPKDDTHQVTERRRRLVEVSDRAAAFRADRAAVFRARREGMPPSRRFFHDRVFGKKEGHAQVKARYGKWVKALEDKPELSAELHRLGSAGLEAFGYEPPAPFLDPPDDAFLQQCQTILEEKLCPSK